MKKLLVYTENYARGGGNRYMIDLINALCSGYDQIVIRSNARGVFKEDLQRLGCVVDYSSIFFFTGMSICNVLHKFPKLVRRGLTLLLIVLEPLFFSLNILLFVFIIRRANPSHVISCNGGYPAARSCLAMVVAAKILRIPVILSIVSMPARRISYRRIYEKIIDKLVWKSVDFVIVNARSIALNLSELREMSVARVEVIFNGVEDRQPIFLKKKNMDQFVIGCIARMDASKGVLVLLEAFAHLSKTYSHLRLVLVGHGDASQELTRRTRELGLQNQVRLVGHHEGDICELVETFDIYAFPSLWEGLPYSIIEAMCAARAIVATKVGGIPEIINHGVEGLLVEPHSVVELTEALERLINNKDLCQSLARNARKKFEQQLTLKQMHRRFREVLLTGA